LNIILVDPVSDKRWDKFVMDHPEGTIFHHSSWAKVLQDRYNTSPTYYAIENSPGEITAIAPFFLVSSPLGKRRLVCLPCSEYCFPLTYAPGDLEKLINRAEEEVQDKNLSYLEIRGWRGNLLPERLVLKPHSYYLNHVTTLEDSPQDLRAKLSRETRYHLNRGERSNVKVNLAQNEKDLKIFHKLTSDMRRRIRLLPWPYHFFQSIYRHLILPGHGFLLLAEVDGKIVSGGLFLGLKEKVINKFNASSPEFIQLRTNYLVMWKAIEYAYEKDYRYFDFGVTNPENNGLIKFKSHWNSQESVLPYYYYPEIRGVNSLPESSLLYKTHTSINKVLPDFALRLAANLLYKRLG
jgi:lipid II:glycine glycyltransferase (peptidoglycan interpeptide bridge formation enzyme)